MNTELFQAEINKYRDVGGNLKFKKISEFVLKLFFRSLSNAHVERVFGQPNIVKTNIRNRLKFKTVIVFVQVLHLLYKYRLQRSGIYWNAMNLITMAKKIILMKTGNFEIFFYS